MPEEKKDYLGISILTITYNPDLSVFKKVLESIKKQNYPKDKIEHIVIDGGSREEVVNLARSYGCKVVVRSDLKSQSERRRAFAVKKAKKEIVLWLESDNILQDKNSFKKLIKPFIDDKKIISTFTLHYDFNKKMKLVDKYCALFGFSDPVAYYLNKADRETWITDRYRHGEIIKRKSNYDIVEFNENNLPTVGDNGFLTRRKILLKANIAEKAYVHIDVYVDLLRLGFKRFGVVKNTSVEHDIGKGFIELIRRRVLYVNRYSLSNYLKHRRYAVFDFNNKKDILNLLKYVFFTITMVQPIYLSVRGYIIKRDLAWFLHPLVCWLFLIYYIRFTSLKLVKLRFLNKI
jgi:hypothetical protein